MQAAGGTTRSTSVAAKDNGSRRGKRGRNDEPSTHAVKATKFRRSNASTSAVASGITGSAAAGIASRRQFPINPAIQAKQTQLFGARSNLAASTGPAKRGNTKGIQTRSTKAHQTTLLAARTRHQISLEDNETKEEQNVIHQIESTVVCVLLSPTTKATVGETVTEALIQSITPAGKENKMDVYRSRLQTVSTSTTAGTDLSDDEEEQRFEDASISLNSHVLLEKNRELLRTRPSTISLKFDSAVYGQHWVMHHRSREQLFEPWQMALTGKIEKKRLEIVQAYWSGIQAHSISPATVFIAVNNFSRLLAGWDNEKQGTLATSHLGLMAFVAYRLAVKVEERPEVLWDIPDFWAIFPMFRDTDIDRSNASVNKVEMTALGVLRDSMDVPLGPMFLSLYISAGGWPQELVQEYLELGLYLLALSTFATTNDHQLRNVAPSKLAAAALVLAVKIVNSDRGSGCGLLRHLSSCVFASNNPPTSNAMDLCTCRYEFYPDRLKAYCAFDFEEIQPAVRGLSSLLRSRPAETAVLSHSFPAWGDNDWQ